MHTHTHRARARGNNKLTFMQVGRVCSRGRGLRHGSGQVTLRCQLKLNSPLCTCRVPRQRSPRSSAFSVLCSIGSLLGDSTLGVHVRGRREQARQERGQARQEQRRGAHPRACTPSLPRSGAPYCAPPSLGGGGGFKGLGLGEWVRERSGRARRRGGREVAQQGGSMISSPNESGEEQTASPRIPPSCRFRRPSCFDSLHRSPMRILCDAPCASPTPCVRLWQPLVGVCFSASIARLRTCVRSLCHHLLVLQGWMRDR